MPCREYLKLIYQFDRVKGEGKRRNWEYLQDTNPDNVNVNHGNIVSCLTTMLGLKNFMYICENTRSIFNYP